MIPLSLIIPAVIGFFIFISGVFTVKQQTAVLIERFGRYMSTRRAGLHFKIPFVDRISGRVNLKIQQLDVNVETKTLDDVFVRLKVSVQYRILPDAIYDAFYKLENPAEQITAYVFDVIRAEVPKLRLDDVFVRKDDIAVAIMRELQEAMNDYGYSIVKALVTDIDPDEAVKRSMNHINAAERQKVAAEFEAEADPSRRRRCAAIPTRQRARGGRGRPTGW